MRRIFCTLAALVTVFAVCTAAETNYLKAEGSAWRLALADLDGDGRNELVYGAYEGQVCAMSLPDGGRLWCTNLGGFPFSVAATEAKNGAKATVYVAAADGKLYAIRPDGTIAWTWRSRHGQALYNAVPFRRGDRTLIATGGMDRTITVLSPDGKPVASHQLEQVAGRMAAADFDADGHDELLVIDRRSVGELLQFDGQRLTRRWRKPLTVPDSMKNWENPAGNFYVFSLKLDDLDGDGTPEIIGGDTFFNRQSVMAASADGTPRWISPPLANATGKDRWYELYSTAWLTTAELDPRSPGKEIVSVSAGLLRIFSAKGVLLASEEAPIGFTDVISDGRNLYLGSSPNGDNTIYRISLAGDYRAAFRSLARAGEAKRMEGHIAAIARAVAAYKPEAPSAGSYDVQMLGGARSEKQAIEWKRREAWFKREFPYANLRPVASVKVIEPTPPLGPDGKPWNPRRWQTDSINGTMTVDQIIEAARVAETHRIPTIFNIGHSCMPFVTLDTAARMLEAAPEYTIAFLSAEDEDPVAFPIFARHYLAPLADLCLRKGGKLAITKNKNVWWMSMPSQPEVFESLFNGGRGRTMQGRTEDSNSRTPELNLMARMGLRQAGLLQSVHAAIIGDLFSFNRFWQWEYPKHGHPWLRLLVAHTLMGADSFEYRSPGLASSPDGPALPKMAEESMGLFLHLLGKGLVFPPAPERQAGISRVGIAIHPPPEKWVTDGHNGHRPEIWTFDPELENAIIPRNGNLWGLTPTPERALQRVLFGKTRQFGYHVPPTPYGAVAMVPAAADLKSVHGVDEWWHTDGIYLWRQGGAKLTGPAAAKALKASFEKAAAKLPFRATGADVFFHSVDMGGGRYRLFAIDPGWLDPADRKIAIRRQLDRSYNYRDLLTNEVLTESGGAVSLTVPAGVFRILEAVPASANQAQP